MATITLTKGDTARPFEDTLTYSDGTLLPLTADTAVYFIMKYGPTVIKQLATIVSAAAATVSYTPVAADVSVVAKYSQEWEVHYPDGKIESVPTNPKNTVNIVSDLG